MVFLIGLLVIGLVGSYAETKKWRRTGVHTFARIQGMIPTAGVMKMLAEKYSGDIKIGMDQVGQSDLYQPVLQALKEATFTEASLPSGEKFAWMFFRADNVVQVWEDVEWAGTKPLDVFLFDVKTPMNIYTFAMPRPCGNLALYKKIDVIPAAAPLADCRLVVSPAKANLNEPITVDMCGTQNATSMTVEVFDARGVKVSTHAFTPADCKWQMKFDKAGSYDFKASAVNADRILSANPCQATVLVNALPICKLTTSCLPCNDFVGKPITFDADGSTDPDGQLVKAIFEVTDEAGAVIDSYTVNARPFTWQKIFYKAGKYAVAVSVFDDMGASSSAAPCKIAFEVTQKKFFWVVELGGLLARGTYTGYFFGRAGMLWSVVPDLLDFVLTMGPAIPTQGDPWKVLFLANAVADLHLGPAAYVGAGLGYSTKEQDARKSGFDFIGQFGVNIFNHFTSAGSIFAEARIPFLTADRPVNNHYKLLLGFRYIF